MSHPTDLNLPPFSRLVFCILWKPRFRYWKRWQAQLKKVSSCWHNLPASEISTTSNELPHEVHFEKTLAVPSNKIKQLLDYLKQTADLWAANYRWKHAARSWWRRMGCLSETPIHKKIDLLKAVIPVHLTVLVLTSSVTVLEIFCTNKNSRENMRTHMSQHQGIQKQSILLQEEFS